MSDLAKQLIEKEKRERTGKLDLGNCGLAEWPDLSELHWLETLILGSTWTEFNEEEKKWAKFESSNNDIENRFEAPPTHPFPIGLIKLITNNTGISDASFLGKLTGLTTLNISYNQISDASFLGKLTGLTTLYINNNSINDASFLDKLTGLTSLHISNNQINDLSPVLSLIKNNKAFGFHKNPITTPPMEVVNRGNAAILRYFEDLKSQGEEIVYEAKMLILGDAGAGKTSLARKIEDSDAEMPDEEKDTTPGISVKSLLLNDRQPDFTMHIWDFGGQEIYHSTHQFFLSKRSLYLLLADGRKEEQLDYWLQMQEIYGQDSRLLLVVNQKGEMQTKLPMSDIRRDFPNVHEKEPTIINLKTDRAGAIELRKHIENNIRNLPQFERGLRTPKKWAIIRRDLESKGEDHISLKEFRKICDAEGITERIRKDDLLDFLHNLGAVLHFKDVAGLNKMVILRPTWATEAVYRLLDHTKKKGDNGHFNHDDLNAVWQCNEYEDYFEELLLLMEKFELCYEAPEQKGLYIVPSLLPEVPPEENNWEAEPSEIKLWYEYGFMPKGIITRLIVRQHHLLENPPIFWKRGAIFAMKGARAEVIESFREKRISIRAKGKDARVLLTLLARDIDALNRSFHFNERMTLKQIVPCNCARCKVSERPFRFEYHRLYRFLENGRFKIECEESWQEVSIPNLLREMFSDANKLLRSFEQLSLWKDYSFSDESALEETEEESPLKVFISYSKYDKENFLVPMTRYLNPLMRGGILETWDDRQILPGEEWDDKIKAEIGKADVVFLLVSTNSLNTDYIWNVEIEAAMKRHEAGTAIVIPVILSKCLWTDKNKKNEYIFPPAKLNALPNKGNPVDEFERENHAWQEVADGIKEILKSRKQLQSKQT